MLFGQNGLISKSSTASIEQKKAEYFEEIQIEIADEQIERYEKYKDTSFITSLSIRLSPKNKTWIASSLKCAEENGGFEEKPNDYENNILLITTKEDYEIVIDIENNKLIASIREDSYRKARKQYTVTYDANSGFGTVESQQTKQGFNIILRENAFLKDDFSFVGWSKNKDAIDGDEEIYSAGSSIIIENDIILYAIWKKETYTIEFNENGGMGTMAPIKVAKGLSTKLTQNTFSRIDYNFKEWNTQADESGENYKDGEILIPSIDMTLFAIWEPKIYQWKKYKVLTKTVYTSSELSGTSMRISSGSFDCYSNYTFSETSGYVMTDYIGRYVVDTTTDLDKYIGSYAFFSYAQYSNCLWKVISVESNRLRFQLMASQSSSSKTEEEFVEIVETNSRNFYVENQVYYENSNRYKYKYIGEK